MSDPADSLTPEEAAAIKQLRAQLRAADPAAIVAQALLQAYGLLAEGAVAKIGDPKARMLIDTMAALGELGEGRLPPEVAAQIRDDVAQLQLAQVQAEREIAAHRAQQSPAGEAPPPAEETAATAAEQQQHQQQRMTDRLWIPGRDPGPPPRR